MHLLPPASSAEEMEQFLRKAEDRTDARERQIEKKMEEMQLEYQKLFDGMVATNSNQVTLLQQCQQQIVTVTAERDLLAEEFNKLTQNELEVLDAP